MQVSLDFARHQCPYLFPRANAWLWQALLPRDAYEVGLHARGKEGNMLLFPWRDQATCLVLDRNAVWARGP